MVGLHKLSNFEKKDTSERPYFFLAFKLAKLDLFYKYEYISLVCFLPDQRLRVLQWRYLLFILIRCIQIAAVFSNQKSGIRRRSTVNVLNNVAIISTLSYPSSYLQLCLLSPIQRPCWKSGTMIAITALTNVSRILIFISFLKLECKLKFVSENQITRNMS